MPPAPASGTRAKTLDSSPLRRALLATGTSEESLAHRLGCSRALVRKLEDGAAHLTVERVEHVASVSPRVGRELAAGIVERLAPIAAALPTAAPAPERALRLVTSSLGDVARELDTALADGCLDDDERQRLDRALCSLGELVASMRRGLRA